MSPALEDNALDDHALDDHALDDKARDVRAGEELDIDKLGSWLDATIGLNGPLTVTQFPSGHSNLTYLVKAQDRELVLRRPPFGAKIASAHDMAREHRVLSGLSGAWKKAPAPVALCDDDSVMGCTFYVVERVRGLIMRKNPPKELAFDATAAQRLSTAFVDTLVELHAVDADAAGLGDLGHPTGYVERQVDGWWGRYEKAKTDAIDAMAHVAKWLREQPPYRESGGDDDASGATLLHNDYKYDNLVLDPKDVGKVRAVLDWEMATRGNPLMDLGTALCYWVDSGDDECLAQLRFGPTQVTGSLDRNGLAQRYAERSGRDLGDVNFYYAFGLFKTAVVVQQIYARYVAGHTKDPRFASMIHAVRALSAQAARVIDQGRLDPVVHR